MYTTYYVYIPAEECDFCRGRRTKNRIGRDPVKQPLRQRIVVRSKKKKKIIKKKKKEHCVILEENDDDYEHCTMPAGDS